MWLQIDLRYVKQITVPRNEQLEKSVSPKINDDVVMDAFYTLHVWFPNWTIYFREDLQYFKKKEYQTESKRNETFGSVIFLEEYDPEDLEFMSEDPRGGQEIGGRPPYWARPLSRGPLEHLPTDFFRLYKPTYPKNIEYQDRSGVPPLQASVATKNLLGARSGTLPEGEPITGGHLHHPDAIHDEEGVVHPRG